MRPASVEYPYDPTEKFHRDEMAWAGEFREKWGSCPHEPHCPTKAVCLEEIAWYYRHRHRLHDDERKRGDW